MEHKNEYASIEKSLKAIAFSSSYNPSHIRVAYPGYLSDIKGQREYAEKKLKIARKVAENTVVKTKVMQEEEWAWEIFSQVVLPMLEFVDE